MWRTASGFVKGTSTQPVAPCGSRGAYFSAHSIASGWVGPMATSGIAQATSLYTMFYYAGSSLFGWLGGLAFAAGWTGTASMVVAITLIAFATAHTLLPQSSPATDEAAQPPSDGGTSVAGDRARAC